MAWHYVDEPFAANHYRQITLCDDIMFTMNPQRSMEQTWKYKSSCQQKSMDECGAVRCGAVWKDKSPKRIFAVVVVEAH